MVDRIFAYFQRITNQKYIVISAQTGTLEWGKLTAATFNKANT
jgi:hypothetical protein